jgi:hypothetical protein
VSQLISQEIVYLVVDGLTRKLEIERIGTGLAQRYNVPFEVARSGVGIAGVYDRPITTPTAKQAVIRTASGVTAAPWRPSLEPLRGQQVQGIMHPTRVVWGPARGLGPKPRANVTWGSNEV